MVALAVVGALVLTGVLIYASLWLVGSLYFQHAVAGLNCLDWRDWVFIGICAAVLIVLWIAWWHGIGSNIEIGVAFK